MRKHGKHLVVWLATGASLAGTASCGATDEALSGRRAEHPEPRAPMPVSSAGGAEDVRQPYGELFWPLDQVIVEDCPVVSGIGTFRPRSQNVPDRDCANDSECGDGFCDRGHCAAIEGCGQWYGQSCVNDDSAPNSRIGSRGCYGICLDGRCRSCVSDEECIKDRGHPDARCGPDRQRNGERACGILHPFDHAPIPKPR
jgi:hypothetical protein